MAPFIKFTALSEAAAGKETTFHFINVALIMRASYRVEKGTLDLVVSSGEDKGVYTLDGDEAQEALRLLQSLK